MVTYHNLEIPYPLVAETETQQYEVLNLVGLVGRMALGCQTGPTERDRLDQMLEVGPVLMADGMSKTFAWPVEVLNLVGLVGRMALGCQTGPTERDQLDQILEVGPVLVANGMSKTFAGPVA
ncbi:hypothetical protein Tco_0231805 [Tanacetum coccineum]